MLPEPGLQAEEVHVEISWRRGTSGRLPAHILIGSTVAGVVEAPAHQADLGGRKGTCWGPVPRPFQVPQLGPCWTESPAPGAWPCYLEISEPALQENCSPRFSCQQKGTRDRVMRGGIPAAHKYPGAEGPHPCRGWRHPPSRCIGTGLSPPLRHPSGWGMFSCPGKQPRYTSPSAVQVSGERRWGRMG